MLCGRDTLALGRRGIHPCGVALPATDPRVCLGRVPCWAGASAHAGCAGLRPYRPEAGILELGVHLRTGHWGKGLATEAARTVIAHAFNDRGASCLFAGHNPDNQASRRLLAKLGFRYTHDELYPPTGLLHPSYLLERAEWNLEAAP